MSKTQPSAAPGPTLVPLVLAAGESTRLGVCKALVELEGKSALERLCAAILEGLGIVPVVISGAAHAEIAEHIAERELRAHLFFNRGWNSGRTSGIQAVARRVGARDLLIAPVDAPLVPAGVFAGLLAEWREREQPEHGWLCAAARAPSGKQVRMGHPLLLGCGLLPALCKLPPEASLRQLREQAEPRWWKEFPDVEVLDDLDTPEDLELLRARLQKLPRRNR